MKIKKEFLLICYFSLFTPLTVINAEEGKSADVEHIRPTIERYVKDVITHSLLREVGQTIERILKQQNSGVVPQLAYVAVQEATLQTFQQKPTLEIVQDIFQQCKDKSLEQYGKGWAQAQIEDYIKNQVERSLKTILDEPVFRKIIEVVVEHAVLEQRKLITQSALEQALGEAVYRQRVLTEMIKQQVEKVIAARAYAAAQLEYQANRQRVYQKARQQQYEALIQQQYQDNLHRQQQILRNNSVLVR